MSDQHDDLIEALHRRVDDEWGKQGGDWPNAPSSSAYVRHAEAMDMKVQPICDSDGSTGGYYTVYAVYDRDYIFGVQPVCLIFEDFSKSVDLTWVTKVT